MVIDSWRDPLTSVATWSLVVGVKAALGIGMLAFLWYGVLDLEGRQGLGRLLRDLRAKLS